MGSSMVVVETLLVNVVNSVPIRTRISTMAGAGSFSNTPSELPITFDSPDACYHHQHHKCANYSTSLKLISEQQQSN